MTIQPALILVYMASVILAVPSCTAVTDSEPQQEREAAFPVSLKVIPAEIGNTEELMVSIVNNTGSDVHVRRLQAGEGSVQLHYRPVGSIHYEKQYTWAESPDLNGLIIRSGDEVKMSLPHHLKEAGTYECFVSVTLEFWGSNKKSYLVSNTITLIIPLVISQSEIKDSAITTF